MSEQSLSQPTTATPHKRTSSNAENTTEAPSTKRRAEGISNSNTFTSPTHVYIVILDIEGGNLESTTEIQGVYSVVEDASNAVRRIAEDYGLEDPECYFTENDGRVYYSTDDSGEGVAMSVRNQIWELKPPGSEPKVDFVGAGEDESEDESGSVEDHEENDV